MAEKGNKDKDAAVAAAGPTDFSLEALNRHFEASTADAGNDADVLLDEYLLGFDEIFKFLNLLGTVFGFVATDVKAKVENIRAKQHGPAAADTYRSVQSMLDHEVREKIVHAKAREHNSAALCVIRLNRALDFIETFLQSLPQLENDHSCCGACQAAYKKTLSKHHPWLVQKTANMAMHMLPTKEGLVHKTCGKGNEAYQKALDLLPKACKAMKAAHDRTEALFKAKNLNDLP